MFLITTHLKLEYEESQCRSARKVYHDALLTFYDEYIHTFIFDGAEFPWIFYGYLLFTLVIIVLGAAMLIEDHRDAKAKIE